MLEKFVAAQIVVSALLLNVVTAFSLLDIKKVVTTFIHSHPIAVLAFIEILLFGGIYLRRLVSIYPTCVDISSERVAVVLIINNMQSNKTHP